MLHLISTWYTAPLIGCFVSLAVCVLIVLTQRWHGRHSLDHDMDGHQKFHKVPVPRIGGVAVFLGICATALITAIDGTSSEQKTTAAALLACSLPAFLAGTLEDLTKRVSVSLRLVASFASAGLAVYLLRAYLTSVDTLVLDHVLAVSPLLAYAFTCFSVAGVANAVNIIDGFNGLASGSVIIMLTGICGLAWIYSDPLVMRLCLTAIAPIAGFMLLNFPLGKIFLGDGGAYLCGFWLAECAIILLIRNPNISTWAVLLVCMYPVFETAFSIWRKAIYRKTGMGRPDKVHFHMLVYRRLIRKKMGERTPSWVLHGLTSVFIWMQVLGCSAFAICLTILDATSSMVMLTGTSIFALCYMSIYRHLVRASHPVEHHRAGKEVGAL